MLKNLKISAKLFVAFAVVIVGLLALGVYGALSINTMATADQNMYNRNLLGISNVGSITENFFTVRVKVLKTV